MHGFCLGHGKVMVTMATFRVGVPGVYWHVAYGNYEITLN